MSCYFARLPALNAVTVNLGIQHRFNDLAHCFFGLGRRVLVVRDGCATLNTRIAVTKRLFRFGVDEQPVFNLNSPAVSCRLCLR